MQTIRIHVLAPPKPDWGAPCNGCGVCCALETCPVGRLRFWRRAGPCPALEWLDAERHYRCGLLQAPRRYLRLLPRRGEGWARRLLARWIAAGRGCDADTTWAESPPDLAENVTRQSAEVPGRHASDKQVGS